MSTLSPYERRVLHALIGVFALRMMGLFLVLPVLTVAGAVLAGASPWWLAVAVGAYGLAQLLFQIPFGWWADRMDRRLLLLIGLGLFVLGGAVAGYSTHVAGVIVGRFLQGAGAISAVVMALMSDHVRVEHRSRGMATLGMSIGLVFALSFIVGPWLTERFGLSGLFYATAVMGLMAMVWVVWQVPAAQPQRQLPEQLWASLKRLSAQPALRALSGSVFFLHLVLMACFVVLPAQLVSAGLPVAHHGWVYLPIMLLALMTLVPVIVRAERRRRLVQTQRIAQLILITALAVLVMAQGRLMGLIAGLALFFLAFNVVEALLPSWLAKVVPATHKGAAMGLYSTSQFAGAFFGSLVGGALLTTASPEVVYGLLGLLVLLWFVLSTGLTEPQTLQSLSWTYAGPWTPERGQAVTQLPGVLEALNFPEDQRLQLTIDPASWDQAAWTAWQAEESQTASTPMQSFR